MCQPFKYTVKCLPMLYELGSHKLIPVGYLHVIIKGATMEVLDFKPSFHALEWHLALLVKSTC